MIPPVNGHALTPAGGTISLLGPIDRYLKTSLACCLLVALTAIEQALVVTTEAAERSGRKLDRRDQTAVFWHIIRMRQ